MWYKKFRAGVTGLCLSVSLVFSPLIFAQTGQEYFNQGVKAAESGDYRAALIQFQKAKKAGLKNAALQYNFGVAHYKLGQYEQSKEAFTELTGKKRFKQLAYYNLGLIANKQKDKKSAIEWFRRAFSTGKSDKVKILAREALKRLGAAPKRALISDKKWTGFLSTSFSSDSNVTLVNDDLAGVTSKSDTSMTLSAYGAKWLSGGSSNGNRLFLRGYLQNYSSQPDYNYKQFGLGAAHYDRLGNWNMRYGGFWDETYLGGTQYQRILSAEVRARKTLSKNNQLRMRYRISSIDATDPVYDYLGGTRQQFRVGAQTRNMASRFRAYYQLELNDREDFKNPAGTTYLFKSYSPTRHTLRVTGWWDITNMWKLRLDGRYRTSVYNDDHILVGDVTKSREDTQTRLSARLSTSLDKNLQLDLGYAVTKNDSTIDSNIDSESYDRNLASAGLTWKFK